MFHGNVEQMVVEKLLPFKSIIKEFLYSCYYKIIHNNKGIDYSNIHSITFLCYGNICRSPFCEYYLKKCLNGKSEIDIYSVGIFNKQGRISPENAKIAANRFNVDLSTHRTKMISSSIVEKSSIVIGMHYSHFKEFKRQFPYAVNKFYLLKHIVNPKQYSINIADPYGKPIEEFSKCYSEIQLYLDLMIENILLHKEKNE